MARKPKPKPPVTPAPTEVMRAIAELNTKLDKVLTILDTVKHRGIEVMLNVEELKAAVEDNANAAEAVDKVIMDSLAAIEAQAGDEAAVRAEVENLRNNTAALVASALKGTPAEVTEPSA